MKLIFKIGLLALVASLFMVGCPSDPVIPGPRGAGVYVDVDPESPTGYTVTFLYAPDYHRDLNAAVPVIRVDPQTVTRVQLYSETMLLIDPSNRAFYNPELDPISGGNAYNLNNAGSQGLRIQPEDFEPGLVNAGGSGFWALQRDLELDEETGLWSISIPLPSGAFEYRYIITSGLSNTAVSRLNDPANPTMVNTATGTRSLSSMVYVPYNAALQGTGKWADRSYTYPRNGQNGRVVFEKYEAVFHTTDDPVPNDAPGATGNFTSPTASRLENTRGLAIYLPFGYNPNRAQPYPVLYISMGASGDNIGNEMRWVHEGAGANILDNLIAAGDVEPFIMVSGNWQDMGSYNYGRVAHDMYNYIIPLMEEKYNVSTEREGRAFAGLSMGGALSTNFMWNAYEDFAYFGPWSHASNNPDSFDWSNLDGATIHFGSGRWDYTMNNIFTLKDRIGDELDYTYLEVPGGHDWVVWQTLLHDFAKNYLWK